MEGQEDVGNLNSEQLNKLNLRLKSQFAGEFIQMMTEVKACTMSILFSIVGDGIEMLYSMHP